MIEKLHKIGLLFGTFAFHRQLLLVLVVLFFGVEFGLRWLLGFGSPPLSMTHPTIEYMFVPNQDVVRFGNRFVTNAWGMRREAFTKVKINESERRVLVVGDSVVNGGSLTDQSRLATSIVEARLVTKYSRPFVVANISAGSWGPDNWLAYFEEYGFFEADQIVLVVNRGDLYDVATFEPLSEETHPTKTPSFAITDLLGRYLPRYLPSIAFFSASQSTGKFADEHRQEELKSHAVETLRRLCKLVQDAGIELHVLRYASRDEVIRGEEGPELTFMKNLFSSCGVSTETLITRCASDVKAIFRDDIHPSELGQRVLADAIFDIVTQRLDKE